MSLDEAIEHLLKRAKDLTADNPHGEAAGCTGVTATWCPIHGKCKCSQTHDEIRIGYNLDCPLHGLDSRSREG